MSNKTLHKELNLAAVFCIAAGAMISSGLFVLPSLVFKESGPSVVLSYFFAALFMIPAMVSQAELATAMPKAGGTYFFIHRSLGALFGTFAGLANWFSISLKSAFALVGIGIFISPLFGHIDPAWIKLIAITATFFFAFLNILSVKESGRFQIILVSILISILVVYSIFGIGMEKIRIEHFTPFRYGSWLNIINAAGMIFISFGGLTKIASVSSEVKNPGKIIPLGMFSAFIVVSVLYVLTVFVTIGLVPPDLLKETAMPISEGARAIFGNVGFVILSVAAMSAFITTANAGIMAASRTPMAMSEDNLLPGFFARISIKFKTPVVSIGITSLFMILVIVFLDLEQLVKVASTMMLLLFMFGNLAVILMRESKIQSYRPKYKSPLYPYMQIAGILIYLVLIFDMGFVPWIITGTFFLAAIVWYFMYSKSRTKKESALIHVVERLTNKELRSKSLTQELKKILMERDDIIEDRFDMLVDEAKILDIGDEIQTREELFELIAHEFSRDLSLEKDDILTLLRTREAESTTAIHEGLAIPHIITSGIQEFRMVIVRSKSGIEFKPDLAPVNIVFALAGSKDERNFHLQVLMAIAQIVQNKEFKKNWLKAHDTNELKNLILLADRIRKGSI